MTYQELYHALRGEQMKKEASVKKLASMIGMKKKAAPTGFLGKTMNNKSNPFIDLFRQAQSGTSAGQPTTPPKGNNLWGRAPIGGGFGAGTKPVTNSLALKKAWEKYSQQPVENNSIQPLGDGDWRFRSNRNLQNNLPDQRLFYQGTKSTEPLPSPLVNTPTGNKSSVPVQTFRPGIYHL